MNETKAQTNPGMDQDSDQIKEMLVRALKRGVAGPKWQGREEEDYSDDDIREVWSTMSITIAHAVAQSGTFPNLSSEDLHLTLSEFIKSL